MSVGNSINYHKQKKNNNKKKAQSIFGKINVKDANRYCWANKYSIKYYRLSLKIHQSKITQKIK